MIALLLTATACNGTAGAKALPTPVVVAQATLAPTATPEPTQTPMPTATLTPSPTATPTASPTPTVTPTATITPTPISPLSVEWGRKQSYPGSDLVIEQKLDLGRNYSRYVASYKSEGLKIYGLLTIPNGETPKTGWPVIIFNHGYIPPDQYRTTERYVAYQDAFAAAGYITFKSDYRGHGSSEGRATGGYGNVDYTIDVMNAMASVKRMKEADPNRIGMWGHSMGGSVTLRAMVMTKEIKAGVIWAGVVASATDQLNRSRATPNAATPNAPTPPVGTARGWTGALVAQYGTPEQNPTFWASISPNSYLADLGGPLQLHHGTADASVPYQYSVTLDKQLKAAGQYDEFYTYPGDDHNLATNLMVALQRSVAFFDKYVKNAS
ncbi:MAG: alpha/beta fold hydrolase [Chloroflexi bacterium]|nr:alpha/beta fold hydrolase [Chloroflexota bacterium]